MATSKITQDFRMKYAGVLFLLMLLILCYLVIALEVGKHIRNWKELDEKMKVMKM